MVTATDRIIYSDEDVTLVEDERGKWWIRCTGMRGWAELHAQKFVEAVAREHRPPINPASGPKMAFPARERA